MDRAHGFFVYDNTVKMESGPAFDPTEDATEKKVVEDVHKRMLNLFWPVTRLMPKQVPFSYTTFKATDKVARVLYIANVNRGNQYLISVTEYDTWRERQ